MFRRVFGLTAALGFGLSELDLLAVTAVAGMLMWVKSYNVGKKAKRGRLARLDSVLATCFNFTPKGSMGMKQMVAVADQGAVNQTTAL